MNDPRVDPGDLRAEGSPSEQLTLLARLALAGSTDNRFLNACWERAYAAARRFGREHHGAEDSAQEAVIVVYRLLTLEPPQLDPHTVGALLRIVVRRHVNEVARRRIVEAAALRSLPTTRRGAHDPAETEEWASRIRATIETLPHQLRLLIKLRHWDDMSTRKIAHTIRTSETSVRRLLTQAETAITLGLCQLRPRSRPRTMGKPGRP